MKTMYLAIIVILFIENQVWCEDEPAKTAKIKREIYNYKTPANYDCQKPPACLPFDSIPNQNLSIPLNSWISQTQLFYITMSSCWRYSVFANMFLGRKVFSSRELKEMCLVSFFGHDSDLATYSGYSNQIYQICTRNEDTKLPNCIFTGGDAGTDWSLGGNEAYYPILSDGMSWIAYYGCADKRYGDIQLFSSRPYVEQSVVTQVLAMAVNQLGFLADEIKILTCNFPTYPVPLQNYPEPDSALSKSCSYPTYPSPISYSPYPQQTPAEPNNPPHYSSHPNHPNPY